MWARRMVQLARPLGHCVFTSLVLYSDRGLAFGLRGRKVINIDLESWGAFMRKYLSFSLFLPLGAAGWFLLHAQQPPASGSAGQVPEEGIIARAVRQAKAEKRAE